MNEIFRQGFEKVADDSGYTWWERQTAANRAIRDRGQPLGKIDHMWEQPSPEYQKDTMLPTVLGLLAGLGVGSLTRNPYGLIAATSLGTAIGGGIGHNKFLKKKGIKPKFLGFSHEVSPEAAAKYIDPYY